jgi:hypothetical protein
MQSIQFPISLLFKVTTFSNDFIAKDSSGTTIAYVREKMLKLTDTIDVYSDESKSLKMFQIRADRWLDFNANYAFMDSENNFLGSLARKGWASLWSSRYESYDRNRNLAYVISEENPFVKVIDGIFGQIPIIGMLTGYFFNPSYLVTDNQTIVAKLIKQPSLFGRKFLIETYTSLPDYDTQLIFLSLAQMVLLERERG